jgi:hypothetical protein
MRIVRYIVLFVLLIALGGFVQTASATLDPMMPTSSYGDGHWQGSELYDIELDDGSFLRGRLDFAVYDTFNLNTEESEWIDGLDLSGEGQYLYSYQVFNDYDPGSGEEVAYFAVFPEAGGSFGLDETSIGASLDPENGVEPTSGYLDDSSDMQVVWTWEPEPGGTGYINAGQHSWYLLYLSDYEPVTGAYDITQQQGELPAPGQVPEPSTVALLGFGALLAVFKRTKAQ